MFIAILGREPKISLAELESYFGPSKITPLSNSVALVASARFSLERFGGCVKAARTIDTPLTDFFQQLPPGKITLGFSDYSPRATARSTWQIALKYKNRNHQIQRLSCHFYRVTKYHRLCSSRSSPPRPRCFRRYVATKTSSNSR